MRKLLLAGLIAGGLIGAAMGQTPMPVVPPVPVVPPAPVPEPTPTPTPLAIAGDLSVPCYGFARLHLTGTYTSAGWLCFPDRTTGAKLITSYTTPKGGVFVFSGPPGAYDVGVFADTPGGMVTIQTVVTVQPASPAPTPPPTPPGPVPPGPTPPGPIPPTPPKPFPSTQLDSRRGPRLPFDWRPDRERCSA